MKNRLLALCATLATCLSMFAIDYMYIELKDGKVVKYNVDDINQAYFGKETKDTSTVNSQHGGTNVADVVYIEPLKFKISSDSTVEVIDGNYSKLDTITIPSKVNVNGKVYSVTGIANWAFFDCLKLRSIDIPESVSYIGSGAFTNCSALTSIKLPKSLTTISDSIFASCTGLKNVIIPDGVTFIDNQAFWECNSLENITIPNSVTKIGYRAFYGCFNLKTVTLSKNTEFEEMTFPKITTIIYSDEELDFDYDYSDYDYDFGDGVGVKITAKGGSGEYDISVNCGNPGSFGGYILALDSLSDNEWKLLLYEKYFLSPGTENSCNGFENLYNNTTGVYTAWIRICVIDKVTGEELCKDISLDFK